MEHRYTSAEVERMMGVTRRELDYWTRLRLLAPRARWGERFFNFSDLVALETIKRLAAIKIPAGRIRRAVAALQADLHSAKLPLSELHLSTNGKQVVVLPAQGAAPPYEPLTGQLVLNFEATDAANKIRAMASRSAEEWFELGMMCDAEAESLEQALEAYWKAVEAAPDWAEARINLGTSMYKLGRMDEALEQFAIAADIDPSNALAEFNLGCVCEQLGNTEDAIRHLVRSIELSPSLSDAHLNLALAYEKSGQLEKAAGHFSLYLRHEPTGSWAEFARARLVKYQTSGPSTGPSTPSSKLTPFRKK